MIYIAWLVIGGSLLVWGASYLSLAKAVTDLNSVSVDHQRVRISLFTNMTALAIGFLCFCLVKLEQTEAEIRAKIKNPIQHFEEE